MNSKFFSGLFALILLVVSQEIIARENSRSCSLDDCNFENKFEIDQSQFDADNRLTLTCPGQYRVTENLQGTIVIADATSICLDLDCHTIDANGATNAIVIQGTVPTSKNELTTAFKQPIVKIPDLALFKKHTGAFAKENKDLGLEVMRPKFRKTLQSDVAISDTQHITVSNGTIIGSANAGIIVANAFDVTLSNLTLLNNAFAGIGVINSNGIKVFDVSSAGTLVGESALYFDTVDNVQINNVVATNYLSTRAAIIQLNSCNAVTLRDSTVTGNTKTGTADISFFQAESALVGVVGSTGVDFVNVKVNNNTINNTVPVDPTTNFRTFEAINFLFCSGCSITDCETSFNTDISGSTATVDTEDFMLCFIFCDNCSIKNHTSSDNNCTEAIAYFVSMGIFDSSSMAISSSSASNNNASELILAPFITQTVGLWAGPYFSDLASTNNYYIKDLQANSNTVTVGGAGRSSFETLGFLAGIILNGSNMSLTGIQVSNNSMGDQEPFTAVTGIIDECRNSALTNITANNNSGSEFSQGILLYSGGITNTRINKAMVNATAHFNGNYGISIGYSEALERTNFDFVIKNVLCQNNGTASGPAAGIIFQPVTGGNNNIIIQGGEIFNTGSDASTRAAGINVTNANNVVIEDLKIFNTASSTTGHGILVDTAKNSKFNNIQLQGNQDAGIELVGTNSTIEITKCDALSNDKGFEFAAQSSADCCFVENCKALSNRTAGFVHALTPLTTTFINNKAQCNGTNAQDNYLIADRCNNAINLDELAWNDGSIITISPKQKKNRKGKKDANRSGFANLQSVRQHSKGNCK